MQIYKYTARDPNTGEKVSAKVQADNERAAGRLITDQGLTPISITVAKDRTLGRFGSRIKTKDKILFARQLSTLINAGLPLVQSLRSVSEQSTNKAMLQVINEVISDVESGKSFSESLGKHEKVFDSIFRSLIEAGEASGTLDKALERLAIQQEKDAEVLSKVRGAMVYPIIVLLVMGGVVSFMLVAVLPQVEGLYDGIDGLELPLITRILLAISNALTSFWWVAIIVVIAGTFFMRRWVKTEAGRLAVDGLKIKVPPFSKLFMELYMARFSRTAQTLVSSGVPLLQVLEIVAGAINNKHVEKSIRAAMEKVKGGKSIADALERDPNFLPLVPSMLRIGEQSGSIEQMLDRTADYYEKEVDTQIKTISTIIEPVLMIVLGIVAITIVAAILLPIYSLVGQNII